MLTAKTLIKFLKDFPSDSRVRAYEGEITGIIVSHYRVSGVFHNSGRSEMRNHRKVGPKPVRGAEDVLTAEVLIKFLREFPSDSRVWGYEGEVSGIIVSHKDGSGVAHNSGLTEKNPRYPGESSS